MAQVNISNDFLNIIFQRGHYDLKFSPLWHTQLFAFNNFFFRYKIPNIIKEGILSKDKETQQVYLKLLKIKLDEYENSIKSR